MAYFGYGSLVNRATHRTEIVAAYRARLHGWKRMWRSRPDVLLDPAHGTALSLLSVACKAEAETDGLLVVDRAENLPAVDEREAHYDRHLLSAADITLFEGSLPCDCPVYVYEARSGAGDAVACPTRQSYLDAVMQGFLAEHGEAGLRAFVFETDGFDLPVLADRAVPLYPRAVRLDAREAGLIDGLLHERGVRFLAV
ncbi:gamma-glutamylcyclotransferase [Pararhizobium mangrovi]|uniref:Gamma-glutamylcyclotransferase n=1 Tax=Pararhizobium mangrovi TaxID=2590452 RepID=A0A506UEQ5_9HYPH|nr:gamma-glutamylcyclotransferase [Pararhizobium mangrovi]